MFIQFRALSLSATPRIASSGYRKRQNSVLVASQENKDEKKYTVIKNARQRQLKASDMLARLLQASDAKAEATLHLSSLTEEFFQISSAYLQMAQQEGNLQVYDQMKSALTAAMEVKQSTLRPEIQLLNKLLAEDNDAGWNKVLSSKESQKQLVMNDGYFFQLLDRMMVDVSQQPQHVKNQELADKLSAIRKLARIAKSRSC